MPTEVDLKLGLNLEIGSVPVALDVEIDSQSAQTTYTFDGCVQNAVIPLGEFIGYVGQQFGVDVQLPPELNLHAEIDYLVGQVIYTKPTTGNPTTELGAAGKFELSVYDDTYSFTFYADTVISSPAPATGNPYVIGASIDLDATLEACPHAADRRAGCPVAIRPEPVDPEAPERRREREVCRDASGDTVDQDRDVDHAAASAIGRSGR